MYDWVELGNRVRILRQNSGLSQTQLAQVTDIPPAKLRSIEYGRAYMRVDQLIALSESLSVSIQFLATGKPTDNEFLTGGFWSLHDRNFTRRWHSRRLALTHPSRYRLSRQQPRWPHPCD